MRLLKKIFAWLLALTILIVTGSALFLYTAPQFGAGSEGKRLARVEASPHYENGTFVNAIYTSMDMSMASVVKTLEEFMTAKNTRPTRPLPTDFVTDKTPISDSLAYITWFGHSAALLEMEGKRILLDPMFGPTASPVSFFGKRFDYTSPIDMDQFTNIDALVISHDHYDHLDYGSVLKLNPEVKHFFVPLGVGAHLERWGVDSAKITELDWWESAEVDGITYTPAPARHFSGRGISDRNKTLWASWMVKGKHTNIYFSGDSGYGPHFKEIGQRFGPFNLAMMECGQYNEKWKAIHMMPEQTMQAFLDVQGEVLMPIHWGAFDLSVHPWTESVERLNRANSTSAFIATPAIGTRYPVDAHPPTTAWWEPLLLP
jgi:L-ascorbate metabolism protein UlaG (beta-lactamase superfamily)